MRRSRLVILLVAATALTAPAAAHSALPRAGTYSGQAPGVSGPNRIDLDVVYRGGAPRLRIPALADDCASRYLYAPVNVGRIGSRTFDFEVSGRTDTLRYRIAISGRFPAPRRAAITVTTTLGDLVPPAGTPPGTANRCTDTTAFVARLRPAGR